MIVSSFSAALIFSSAALFLAQRIILFSLHSFLAHPSPMPLLAPVMSIVFMFRHDTTMLFVIQWAYVA